MGPNRNRTPLFKPVPPCVQCNDPGGPVHPNSTTGRPERTLGLCKVCYERLRQQKARHRRALMSRGWVDPNKPERDEAAATRRKSYPAWLAECPTLSIPGTSTRIKVYIARAERGYNLRTIGDRKHYATWADVLRIDRTAGKPDTPEWHPPMALPRVPVISRADRRALKTWRAILRDPGLVFAAAERRQGKVNDVA